MMSRFRLIMAEAARSLQASVSTTFAATMTVLVCMFLLGFTIALGTWAWSLGDHYKKELVVKVFFNSARPWAGEVIFTVLTRVSAWSCRSTASACPRVAPTSM